MGECIRFLKSPNAGNKFDVVHVVSCGVDGSIVGERIAYIYTREENDNVVETYFTQDDPQHPIDIDRMNQIVAFMNSLKGSD